MRQTRTAPEPSPDLVLSAFHNRRVDLISFARGVPAPECLPVDELADCARAAVEEGGAAVLSYGPAAGYGPLRELIADRHGVGSERVVVTSGSLQGLVFLTTALLECGRRVLVESPTYDRPLKILAGLGAEVVGVAVDEEGLDPDALAHELESGPPPAFLYTIPTFQNPTGHTLSLERRRRVVELARSHDLLIVEDDPYGLVRFEGRPLPSLFELTEGSGAVYSSSFSKTIAPGVRVGYLVLPPELAHAVEARATASYISPPYLTQATVHEFLRRRLFEPNLIRVCELLRARRDAMIGALERELPEAQWSRPEGGYFLWLELPEGAWARDLLEQATAAAVTFVPGNDFFPGRGGGEGSARLAYSFASPAEIGDGIGRLAGLFARFRQAAPSPV
jgi:2-aminoadipate transaminase